jgi:acetyl esterase/lipase
MRAYLSAHRPRHGPRHITLAGDSSWRRPGPFAADQPQAAGHGSARRRRAVLSRSRPLRRNPRGRASGDPELAAALTWLRRFAAEYLAGHPIDDVVNPLTADLSDLPPMLIQAATGDHQLEDARKLADHARRHGVDARLELYPVDTHVFHVFWSLLPTPPTRSITRGASPTRSTARSSALHPQAERARRRSVAATEDISRGALLWADGGSASRWGLEDGRCGWPHPGPAGMGTTGRLPTPSLAAPGSRILVPQCVFSSSRP